VVTPGKLLVIVKPRRSVSKKYASVSTEAALKQPCAAGYSGWLGVATVGVHVLRPWRSPGCRRL
jgi:hypothetical protein